MIAARGTQGVSFRVVVAAALFAALSVVVPAAHADHVGKVVQLKLAGPTRRFVLEAKLGQGWWSEVYRARALDGGPPVAVKILRDDRRREGHSDAQLFGREQYLARATDPTLLRVDGMGDVEGSGSGRKALVMQLASGRPLVANWWDHASPRQPVQAVQIIMQVLRAARALHRTGVRHNDIQPANVLLTNDRPETVKLVDLGAASLIQDQFHSAPSWYIAPEQSGNGDTRNQVRSDVYSVGAVLDFLLTGPQPKTASLPQVSANVGGQTVWLHDVVKKAMAPDPKDRYESAQAMLDALRPFAGPALASPTP